MFEDWTNCHECEHNPTGDKCELFGRVIGMHGCSSGIERKPRNHFEMFKAMTMDELAVWLDEHDKYNAICPDYGENCEEKSCRKCWLDWLKEEI